MSQDSFEHVVFSRMDILYISYSRGDSPSISSSNIFLKLKLMGRRLRSLISEWQWDNQKYLKTKIRLTHYILLSKVFAVRQDEITISSGLNTSTMVGEAEMKIKII